MNAERIIKKYSNRRLYDTAVNKYIALDDIRRLVTEGESVKVIDAQSGEDITRAILLQIIVDQEKSGQTILSSRLLEQLIRFYDDALQTLVGTYLEKSLEVFVKQQRVFHDQMEHLIRSAPKSIFTEITGRNLELWEQMQRNFMQAFVNVAQDPKKSGGKDDNGQNSDQS